ncbi:MFS transporter [Arthrobacter woluwensis]|uniref:Fucose permease n=1 Tax=Arthrobacter woluwensis TaxID=156980 RepID=A0A1H4VM94_9MICC|nr:MFS transporter [Arthrobacter woluwensis]SEC82242.1 Fucose permease [Arthrobacter woluwensis]
MSQPAAVVRSGGMTTQRVATAAAFFLQGFLFITMTTHLPQIQGLFGLDAATLSLVLLGMVVLAGAGSVLAGQIARRLDSAQALRVGLGLIGAGAIEVGLAPDLLLFCLFLAVYGVGLGTVDASMNMQGVALEHRLRRTLLPGFHAAWTAGGIVATLAALAFGEAALAASVTPFGVVAVVATALPFLRRDRGAEAGSEGVQVSIPWKRLMLVGLVLVLFYMVDTAASTWGPAYLHDLFGTGLGNVAVATLPYLVASLLARLAGDWAVGRFGAVRLLRAAAVLSAAALAVVVLAPNAAIAVLGFAVLGFGAGIIAPLSFSVAGSIAALGQAGSGGADDPVRRARVDSVIARFNQFNYVGALLGSVLTGLVGADSLRLGFALPLVLVLAILPLAGAFRDSSAGRDGSAVRGAGAVREE